MCIEVIAWNVIVVFFETVYNGRQSILNSNRKTFDLDL